MWARKRASVPRDPALVSEPLDLGKSGDVELEVEVTLDQRRELTEIPELCFFFVGGKRLDHFLIDQAPTGGLDEVLLGLQGALPHRGSRKVSRRANPGEHRRYWPTPK